MAEASALPANDTEQEYRAIEQTLLETARGRWFLAEHGRRARRLDMTLLEDAIGKLSSSLNQPPPVLGLMRLELEKLSGFIAETRGQLLAKSSTAKATLTSEGKSSAAVTPTGTDSETPVSRMLRMAEDIHELTWTLQADELSPESCEAVARHASMLYAVSRQQAMESDRALKFADALDDATNRLTILLDTLMHELHAYEADAAAATSLPAGADEPQRAAS